MSSLASKTLISADSINKIGDSKVIVEAKSKESEMGFLISGVKLAFPKLSQAFSTASILYYFDLECHICIKTDR